MYAAVDAILVGHQAKFAKLGLYCLLGYAFNRTFVAQAIANKIGDRADLQSVLAGKDFDLRAPRHAAIVVHEFAQHTRGLKPGQHAQIHRRFGVSRSNQDSAATRSQWKDMAWPRKVLGGGARIHERTDGGGAVA